MNIHRRSVTVVLLVIALLASVTVVSAQGNSSLSATVNNFLNVRALPDIKSYDYGRLAAETEITLIGRTADSEWVKLTTAEGTIGWARENAVTAEGDIADLPVLSVGTDQAVVLRFVTLRANQGIDSGSETRLEQGAMVTLLATDGEWLYVRAEDGTPGWVSPRGLAFVRARGADEASQPELPEVNASVDGFANVRALPELSAYNYERLDPGTPVTLIGRSGDAEWVQVQTLDGLVAWGTTRAFKYDGAIEDLPAVTYADNQGVVTRFAVLRTAPNSTSDQVAELSAGTVVDLLLSTGDRVYVQAGDVTGWTVASALAFPGGTMPETLAANATVTVTTGVASVNLRAAPSADAARLGWVGAGERVSVIGVSADGAWYRVVPSSRVAAWVLADLVTLDDGVGPLPVVE